MNRILLAIFVSVLAIGTILAGTYLAFFALAKHFPVGRTLGMIRRRAKIKKQLCKAVETVSQGKHQARTVVMTQPTTNVSAIIYQLICARRLSAALMVGSGLSCAAIVYLANKWLRKKMSQIISLPPITYCYHCDRHHPIELYLVDWIA